MRNSRRKRKKLSLQMKKLLKKLKQSKIRCRNLLL